MLDKLSFALFVALAVGITCCLGYLSAFFFLAMFGINIGA